MFFERRNRGISILYQSLEGVQELSRSKDGYAILVIIDGNDKYYRTNSNASSALEQALEEIKGHKKIICIGEKTNVHVDRDSEDYIERDTSYTFKFLPIYITEKEKCKEAVKRYCKLQKVEKQINTIHDCIQKFNIKEIDYNLLTVFIECSKKADLKEVISLSSLYDKYCRSYLGGSVESLEKCIELAYTYFMTTDWIDQKVIAEQWREWELIHQNKSTSNYLLALYYSKIFIEYDEEQGKKLEYVFTNGMNVFLKSIINNSKNKQKKVISTCKCIFEKGGFKSKAQAAYLLGRISDGGLKKGVEDILLKQKEALHQNMEESLKDRETCFWLRSINVSLLRLGVYSAGDDLLSALFNSSVMNEVNRAFYLQYYDDVRLEAENVNLEDNGENPITHTANALMNYIETRLQTRSQKWENEQTRNFQIHLFTLCSLVQARLEKDIENELLEKLKKIISKTFRTAEGRLNKELKIYLSMMKEYIEGKNYYPGHIYEELYKTKEIQRKGWQEKIKEKSVGNIPRFENLAEHMYCAWLMGMLYLPETLPSAQGYEGYDKQKILYCLLIKDLAKVYVGDRLPEDVTDNYRNEENKYMRRIFMHDTYMGIGEMDDYRKAWKQYYDEPNNINVKIARDIDMIQSIYQFGWYKEKGIEFIDDREEAWRKEEGKIETDIGQDIFKEVVLKRFKDILEEED